MKTKFKQLTALLLSLIMLASCSAGTENASDTDASAQTSDNNDSGEIAQVEEEEPELDPYAGLPEADYEGHDFHMLTRPLERFIKDIYAEEINGDAINDAVFERNSAVSEKYNVSITYQESSNSNYETDAVSTIMAGDDSYDMVLPHGRATFTYANQKLALDWNKDLPYVKIDADWWSQDARKSLSINNKLYAMIGDLSYNVLGCANVMLFNKALFTDMGLEAPYDTVLEGKWTYDMWQQLVRDGSRDLNGDGEIKTDDDQFGYVTSKWVGSMQAFATSGLRVLEKDENDIPYISIYSEKAVEVFDRFFSLVDDKSTYVDTGDVSFSAGFIKVFTEGRSLFIDMNMNDVLTLREMDADFGIIPWPKYDEGSDYCTNVDAVTSLFIIPITAASPERTSVILEALGALSSIKVIPAFYEVSLQSKASRDTESSGMLDIVKKSVVFDLGYYNADAGGVFANEFVNFIDNTSLGREFTSWYEKNAKSAGKSLEKLVQKYTDDAEA